MGLCQAVVFCFPRHNRVPAAVRAFGMFLCSCIVTHDQAAKESRRRKKMRIEELGRSVVFLTKENQELREQNELLRQMVVSVHKCSIEGWVTYSGTCHFFVFFSYIIIITYFFKSLSPLVYLCVIQRKNLIFIFLGLFLAFSFFKSGVLLRNRSSHVPFSPCPLTH